MDFATAAMVILAVALVIVAYLRHDGSLSDGLKGGMQTLVSITPLLIAAFVVAGLAQALIPKELVAEWLGQESGLKGIFIASGIGALTPGGPFVSYPLVAVLYQSGAGIGPVVAFVTAWSLWAVSSTWRPRKSSTSCWWARRWWRTRLAASPLYARTT